MLTLEFDRRPSVVAYHLRALARVPGQRAANGFPPIRAVWRRARMQAFYLKRLLELTELRADQGGDILFPHVFGFPLQMAIITHRAFPLTIWRALQIRNCLVRHRPLPLKEELDLETSVADQRVLEKGAEVDLYSVMRASGELIWEGVTTFYYRGRFDWDGTSRPSAKAPVVSGEPVTEWTTQSGGGRQFAALSGDYNGIHYWRWYAQALGFRQAFFHPQRVLGQCLARLPAPRSGEAQRLDVWLKGPVHYGSRVSLLAEHDAAGQSFALRTDSDPRPAIVGRWVALHNPRAGTLEPAVARASSGNSLAWEAI